MKAESRRIAIDRNKNAVRRMSNYPNSAISRDGKRPDVRSRSLRCANNEEKSIVIRNHEWMEFRELKKENIRLRKEIQDAKEDLRILKAAIKFMIKWEMIWTMYAYILIKIIEG